MAVGGIGGYLSKAEPPTSPSVIDEDVEKMRPMTSHWSNHLQEWPHMKHIADRSVGSVLASNETISQSSLHPTAVTWLNVFDAWDAQHSSAEVRKLWVEESLESKEDRDNDEAQSAGEEVEQFDDVFENVKADPNLTVHERRLLGCFVTPCKFSF